MKGRGEKKRGKEERGKQGSRRGEKKNKDWKFGVKGLVKVKKTEKRGVISA